MTSALPYPPFPYMNRVGSLTGDDALREYDELGRLGRDFVLRHLPAGYYLADKQVLDFGCGAGRTLRHFIELERGRGTVVGCDIHAPSIEWINEHLSPAVSAVAIDEDPPLPWPDDTFDLVFGLSVFTHLAVNWSAWLLELHRVLRADGILVLTFLGTEFAPQIFGPAAREGSIGMAVLRPYGDWEFGGPMVVHSQWWIREHWGRAFTIEQMHSNCLRTVGSPVSGQGPFQSCCVLTPKQDRLRAADLEREAASDPRDYEALKHALELSWLELRDTDGWLKAWREDAAAVRAQLDALRSGDHDSAP